MDGPAPEQQSAPAQAEVPPVAMFRDVRCSDGCVACSCTRSTYSRCVPFLQRCQALRGRLNQLGVCSIDVETTVENDTNAAMLDTVRLPTRQQHSALSSCGPANAICAAVRDDRRLPNSCDYTMQN